MQYRILGPLVVLSGDRELPLGALKDKTVLAVLLLHANEVVSRQRLIDELWGELPPPTAVKAVNGYVSQLRKALGENGSGPIATRPPGYAIELAADQLDALRFAELTDEARARANAKQPEHASAIYADALALWRGNALAGIELESVGRHELERLDESRIVALMDRIDCDLALGRHDDLVGELDVLVAEHPLRERLYAQQMLALYRSGRQADALRAYQQARSLLVDELGLEPSPALQRLEGGILNHDPSLQTPTGTAQRNGVHRPAAADSPKEESRARRKRKRRWALLGVAVALGAVAAAVIELSGSGGGGNARVAVPNSVVEIDSRSGRILGVAPIAGEPGPVSVSGRLIWIATASRTLSAISAGTLRTRLLTAPNLDLAQLAAGRGRIWAVDAGRRTVAAIDPVYGTVVRRIALPAAAERSDPAGIALAPTADGGVWVTDGGTRLLRYDAAGRLRRSLDLHRSLAGVAVGHGAVWVLSGTTATLLKLDPGSGAILDSVRLESRPGVAAPLPFALAFGAGAIWVLEGSPPSIVRVDPTIGAVTTTIPLGIGSDPVSIAAGEAAIWIANSGDGTLARIDPATNTVRRIVVGGSPTAVAAGAGRIWLTVQLGLLGKTGGVPAPLAEGTTGAVHELPPNMCSPVYAEGKPDTLLAADLPLQGSGAQSQTLQMSNAIRFVLARHHYRAGRFAVGYQLCDDSSAQAGSWTPETCRANARAIAADSHVIGLIGPFNSGCAQVELPLLARASAGPVPVVSASTTYIGLTHKGPGTPPGEPSVYRARGRPIFARVVAADDRQGEANAVLAKRLGVHRLFLLDDGGLYGRNLAAAVRSEAESLGIAIAGTARLGEVKGYGALARGVAATHPDAVFIGAVIDEGGNELLQRLRAALGPHAQFLLPDGFTPFPVLLATGPAVEGATVTFPGPAPSRLTETGREFVTSFTRAIGHQPEPYTVAVAQAAEAMLAAIAHSDGTRASVATHLLHDPITNGILGSFHFDANGDTSRALVSVFQVKRGQARLLTVITPSARGRR
jgi:DNA-binding SARP family transcriptional activator/ABC-type branched-subunit amino acid transport system substrate-binding protein/streptogramin lyase